MPVTFHIKLPSLSEIKESKKKERQKREKTVDLGDISSMSLVEIYAKIGEMYPNEELPKVKGLIRRISEIDGNYYYVRKVPRKTGIKYMSKLEKILKNKRLKIYARFCFFIKNCSLKEKCWDLKHANWNFEFIPDIKIRRKKGCIGFVDPVVFYTKEKRINLSKIEHVVPWKDLEPLKSLYSLGLNKISLDQVINKEFLELEILRLNILNSGR